MARGNGIKLTVLMEKFCQEFIKDPTQQTQAAIRAGYSNKTAANQATRMLKQQRILDRIEVLMTARNKRTKIDADKVLLKLSEMVEADIIDILNDDGSVKPVQDWPPVWRKSISGFEINELFDGVGKDREQIGFVKKVKLLDKARLLELVGKHVDVQAFKERVQVDVNISLSEKLAAARRRVAEKNK
jgi:phage terminase small subunit